MVIRFETERILDIARMIDRSAGAPKMYSDLVGVEFSADYALFSRPEFQVDKGSYPAPTFAALRNAIQSIYWHPGFNIIPLACLCRNPVVEENIATNGLNIRKKSRSGHICICRSEPYAADSAFFAKRQVRCCGRTGESA